MPNPLELVTGLPRPMEEEGLRDNPISGSLEEQLQDLYSQRQELHRALGTADAKAIIAMVRSLERQLVDIYGLLRGRHDHLPAQTQLPPPMPSWLE